MTPVYLKQVLENNYGSYVRPFLWYSGENKELVAREIRAIADAGAKEFVFENRGGDWFGTDFWWDIFGFVLDYAKSLGMRVWALDDSHVNTGSANDSLAKEENACYRAINLRMDMVDVVGPIAAGAVSLPRRTENEKIIKAVMYRRDPVSGISCGKPVDVTGNIQDGLCLIDLEEGIWRIYYIMTTDPKRHGLFGSYITMVSKESCRHLINEIHEKMYEHFSEYFGNTFAGFFSDEPAFGNCDGQYGPNAYNLRLGMPDKMFPWWHDFPQRLAERYNSTPEEVMTLLPALWDNVAEVSAPLRLAYMDIVSKLWQENFSEQLGQWCSSHHVEYIGHNLEDADAHMRTGWGCGHYFRSMKGQHMSGMDIVFDQITPGISSFNHAMADSARERTSPFYHYTLPKLAASLAHQTPHMKNRALSEVFGATGWTCGLSKMRSLFNHALIGGVNNYVPHAYAIPVPKVFESQADRANAAGSVTPPGYCMTYLPPTFHAGGYNPQFGVFGDIIRHVQRVSHIITHGQHRPDVAVYYCAESDWMNMAPYRSIDDVAMYLSRGGYDFEFLPLDAIANECTVKDKRLVMANESYPALILPMSGVIPEVLLEKITAFAEAGVQVFFTDALPERTEKAVIDPAVLENIRVLPCETLGSALAEFVKPALTVAPELPDLRRYSFVGSDGVKGEILLNASCRDMTFTLPEEYGIFYNPWSNKLYRIDNGSVELAAQTLAIVYAAAADESLEAIPALPVKWQTLDLDYNIYTRSASEKEFRLLRADSKAVNLNIAENLTRYCGEFRYESEFECSDPAAYSTLQIPQAGDAAQLIINGVDCGTDFGPCCRFNIAAALKAGKNSLIIKTWDNPAYADRQDDKSIGYGSWFPLQPHGFTGNLQIG
ncbi:MAG: hypothetical protein E7056_08345 [Lentisphaerae bacterium]|nr:hypothetical protein [Lentisphaerota bacterium]